MNILYTPLRTLAAIALFAGAIPARLVAQTQQPQPPRQAQEQVATINGRVEKDGTPLPGVDVLLRRRGEKDEVRHTDERGGFSFDGLSPQPAVIIVNTGKDVATNYINVQTGKNAVTISVGVSDDPSASRDSSPAQPATHAAAAAAAATPAPSPTPAPAATPRQERRTEVAAAAPVPHATTYDPAAAVRAAAARPTSASLLDSFCQAEPGANYPFDTPRPVSLNDLLADIKKYFGVNFAADPDVQNIKLRSQITDVPWTSILRLQLEQNGLEALCYDGKIVRVMTRAKYDELTSRVRKEAPRREVKITLKYIRPTQSGPVDSANQPIAGGGVNTSATIQSVEQAIRRILKASGDEQSDVSQIPGTSTFLIYGTDDQITRINRLIAEIDVPQPQIEIRALVITDSTNFLSDAGFQLAGVAQAGGAAFGITTIPSATGGSGSTTGSGSTAAGLRPGLVPVLTGVNPANTLGASSPNTGLGLNTLIGSTQLTALLTLAKTQGKINIQSRYRTVVGNGKPTLLEAGQAIFVPVTNIAGGVGVTSGVTPINAKRSITVTPQVAERGPDGRMRIVLTLKINNDSVNTSLSSIAGQLPTVDTQSVQTELEIADGETVILGGVDVDSQSNSKSSSPGFLGWFLKRKQTQRSMDRLYFLIQPVLIEPGAPISDLSTAPKDAKLDPVPPPEPQRPGPYDLPAPKKLGPDKPKQN